MFIRKYKYEYIIRKKCRKRYNSIRKIDSQGIEIVFLGQSNKLLNIDKVKRG